MLLDKLTLIIPTYNSPEFLKRTLSYFDSFGLKLNILVADSSRPENKDKNVQIIASLKYLKVKHLNNFDSEISPYLKWYQAMLKVKTKYCMLCADDDFISINSLVKALNLLEENPSYSAVEGKELYFVKPPILGITTFHWKHGDVWTSFEQEDAAKRFENLARGYQPILYAVYRTNFLQYIFRQAYENNSLEYPFGEFLPSFLTVVTGKVKRLDCFFTARDKTIDFQREEPQVNLIQQYKEEGSFTERYNNFKKPLVRDLAQISNLSLVEAEKIVDKHMNMFFGKQQSKKFIVFMKGIVRKNWWYYFFAKAYILGKWLNFDIRRMYHLRKLLKENHDFNRIKWFIRHYPIKCPPKSEKFIK